MDLSKYIRQKLNNFTNSVANNITQAITDYNPVSIGAKAATTKFLPGQKMTFRDAYQSMTPSEKFLPTALAKGQLNTGPINTVPLQKPLGQALAGFTNMSTLGLVDMKTPDPTGALETGARYFGYGLGLVNPVGVAPKVLTPIGKIGENAVTRLAPRLVGKPLVNAVARGVGGEIAQTAAYDAAKLATGQDINPAQDLALGLGARGALGAVGKVVGAGIAKHRTTMAPRDIQDVKDTIAKMLNNRGRANYVINERAKDEQFLRQMASDYLDKNFAKSASLDDVAQELMNRIRTDQNASQFELPSMGIASTKSDTLSSELEQFASGIRSRRMTRDMFIESVDKALKNGNNRTQQENARKFIRLLKNEGLSPDEFYAKSLEGWNLPELQKTIVKNISSEGVVTRKGKLKSVNIPTQTEIKNRAEVSYGNPDLYTQRKAKWMGEQGSESNIPTTNLTGRTPQSTARLATQSSLADSLQAKQTRKPVLDLQGQTVDTSFENMVRSSGIDVNKKVGILDYFRTPDRVLQKMGLGREAGDIRKAYDNYLSELPNEINKITEWSKRVSPEGNVKIFQYLDGQKGVQLDPNEMQVATEIKQYLKEWANKLNLPDDRRITNYITHIFDRELIQKEFDPELAKIIRDKVAGSVYDPFTEQRLGKLGYIEDTWQALDAYVKRGVRKANMDPVLKVISDKAQNFEESQFDYVKSYIARVNMQPTKLDNLLDNTIKQFIGYKLGQRPTTVITRALRQAGYRGTLGLNVGSALRNLTQGANTYAKLGEKYTILGYSKLAQAMMSGSDELEKVGVLRNDFVQDRTLNATKKLWERLDKGLFAAFELAEKINRGSAYFGAKAKALSQGMNEDQAIEYAKKIVRDTQFQFGSVDTPRVLSSDLAKTFGQFQSYNMKQAEFLAEMAKSKDFAGLARYTLASLAMIYTVGKLVGADWKDAIPFSSLITGDTKIGQTPAISGVLNVKDAVLGGKDKYGNEMDMQDRIQKVQDAAIPLIPGGVQLKKTFQGIRAGDQGYSESASGRVQYPIPNDAITRTRAAVFGKNNLPQAQEYFDSGRKPLGDTQSEAFKRMDDASREKYYNQVQELRAVEKQKKDLEEQAKASPELVNKASADTKGGFLGALTFNGKLTSKDTTPQGSQVIDEVGDKIAKENIKSTGEAQMLSTGDIGYKNSDGGVSVLKLKPPTGGSGIDAFTNQNWEYSKAREVAKANIPQDMKNDIYQTLGVTNEQVDYDYKATKSNDIKTQYILSKAKNLDHKTLLDELVKGRQRSVSGSIFASDGVINSLKDAGVLNEKEAKTLKDLDFDVNGKRIQKAKKLKVAKVKVGRIRVPKIKAARTKPIKLKPIKVKKVTYRRPKFKVAS